MASKNFEDLEIWKLSREFCTRIYKITEEENFRRDYGLKDQLRRAAVSIVSNVAEGFERNGNKELIQFLSFSKGSAGEIRAQLYVASDLGYINENQFSELSERIKVISKMIAGFIKYLKQSDLKGTKFSGNNGSSL